MADIKHHVRRHGRPSSEVPNRLRFDQNNHWPHAFSGWDGRVRCVNCKNQTNMFCLKCEVPLCCHSKRNCFMSYHTEENDQIVCLPEYLQSHLGLSQSESDPDDLEERENTQEDRENTQEDRENTQEEELESFLDSGL